jgi:filamentous hemagglutinin family protein
VNQFALRPRRRILWLASGLICFQSVLPVEIVRGEELAGVSGGTVVAGQAAITQDASTLNVNTLTDRTIINWNGFSIGAGETANFIQPGANSAVLNRVTTQNNPSAIFGAMNSNGNVILVNPSGILVGAGGVINTNGFTASVLDIPNNEFLKGGVLNFRGNSTASVINEGTINTGTGGAALIGGNVINNGSITSEGGSISLATGGSVTLADGSRFTHADMATIESGISPTAGLIQNSGTIRATGAMETGGEVYLVNPGGRIMHDGTIEANKGANGGSVDIAANNGGIATVAGVIDASGDVGGRVVVQADHVELQGADIDVSGMLGGGNVKIGGGLQGKDAMVSNAMTTTVDAGSMIRADANQLGDGGEVIIWADDKTVFAGTLSARGGALGGDGGFIETSGPHLELSGRVDLAGGRSGASGTWLIDPVNVIVDAAFIATILPTLEQGSDVIITTAAAGTDPGDITFVDPLTVDFANDPSTDNEATLTALANNSIVQSAAITAQNGVLNLDFQAGTSVTVDASVATNHGDITFIADDIVITGAGAINANTGGVTIERASLGNVMLGTATAIGGLHLDQAELATIDAETLVIGGDAGANNIGNMTVNSANATTGTIAGDVVLNVLGSANSQITFAGDNVFNGLIVRSNKGISFDDFSFDTTTTVNGSAALHADFDGVGSGIEDIFFFGNTAGGAHSLAVVGDLLMVPDNQGASLDDAGGIDVTGTLTIELSRAGSLGVGSSTGATGSDFRLTQAEIDVISAADLNLGAPLEVDSNTTVINVGAIDLTAFDTVNMSAFGGASINYAGFNSFVTLNAVDGTDINVLTGATVSATTSIHFDAPVVNLDGHLDAPVITSTATTVNVLSPNAEIQQAVAIVADGGTVGLGAGTFDGFTIERPGLTFSGAGATTIVNASSPAITIAADNTTVQNMLLQGTGAVDEVGILLDGTAAAGLTGVQIVNVDFSNLDDGIRSQGDIGIGAAADVTIRGTGAANPAIFEDFLDAAIDVGDTNGDAVYVVQDVIVRDGDASGAGTGGDGMRFGAIGGVTVNRGDISGATGDGIQFGALNGAAVMVSNSSIVGALSAAGNGNGLNFNGLISNGSQINISSNSRIESLGGLHGILFEQAPTGATTKIDINNNTLIQSAENQGIVFARGANDLTVIIRGNGTDASNGIRGPQDAISVNNALLTNVNFLVGGDTVYDGNFVSSAQQGLDIEGVSGGTFVVANNALIQGSSAIEFEKVVSNGGEIIIVNNSDLDGVGAGVQFLGGIAGSSNATIAGNTFANTAGDAIQFAAGQTIDAGTITIGSANVTVDGTAIAAGGNIISGSASGINVSSAVQGNTNFNITDNTIGSAGTRVGQDGMRFSGGVLGTATVTIGGTNQVFATQQAIQIDDLQSPTTVSITGGTYNANGGALLVDNTGVAGSDGRLNVGAAAFAAGAGSSVIEVLTDAGNAGVDIDLSGAATFDGGAVGLLLSGPGIDILNDTLGNIGFTNQTNNYIELANGAEFSPGSPTIIDATEVSFDGVLGRNLSPAQLFALEDLIVHFPDDSTLGLINTNDLFVVNGESIQLAVNAAGALGAAQQVIVGAGTFGGSVEVWVDDLTLLGQGATTIIDTDAVDAFANNGDRDTGFELTASSSDAGGAFLDRLVVEGVTIDGFSFLGSNRSDTTGVLLGEGFRQASNTTIQNSGFNRLLDGIVGRNVDAQTTISNVRMRRIASQGIDIRNTLGGNDVILIEDSNIVSDQEAVRFLRSLNGTQVTIRGNRLTSENFDAIRFVSPIRLSNVLIGGPLASDANHIRGADEGIDVEDNLTLSLFVVEGNRWIEGGDDAITVDGAITASRLAIVDNRDIIGSEDGVNLNEIFASQVLINGNRLVEGTLGSGIEFDGLIDFGSTVEVIANGDIIGDDYGVEFDDSVDNSNVRIARNDRIRGKDLAGISFRDAVDDSEIRVVNNSKIRGGDDGVEFQSVENSLVRIAGNEDIVGDLISGVGIFGSVRNSNVRVSRNERIDGGDYGLLFDSIVSNSNLTVDRNDRIIGDGQAGIAFEERIRGNSVVDLVSNTIISEQNGVSTESVRNRSKLSLIDNTIEITADGNGMRLRNLDSSEAVLVQGGSTTGGAVGLRVTQERRAARDGKVIVDGLVVNQASDTGIEFMAEGDNKTLEVTLLNAVTVNGGVSLSEVAMVFDGLGLSLTGETLGDTRFVGNAGNFIELRNGGLFAPGLPTLIDGTSVDWDGLEARTDLQQINDRIVDFLDDQTLGLIFPGSIILDDQTYDRFTRYQDYFRTYGALLNPFPVGRITYPTPSIDIAESLEDPTDGQTSASDEQPAESPPESEGIDLVSK